MENMMQTTLKWAKTTFEFWIFSLAHVQLQPIEGGGVYVMPNTR